MVEKKNIFLKDFINIKNKKINIIKNANDVLPPDK